MRWPKSFPPLTEEQTAISDDFMKFWHQVLPRRYGVVERFNHGFAVAAAPSFPGCRTLEIGAGLGEHLAYEQLAGQDYHCVEIRETMVQDIKAKFPDVTAIVGDCQQRLPYPEARFDRILAIHVLEHLPDLPAAMKEVHRLLDPGGLFCAVIPCDPGVLYEIARKISAERIFKKRYNQPYEWFIRREHINSPEEILWVLSQQFSVERKQFFPFRVPVSPLNLCLGLLAKKRAV